MSFNHQGSPTAVDVAQKDAIFSDEENSQKIGSEEPDRTMRSDAAVVPRMVSVDSIDGLIVSEKKAHKETLRKETPHQQLKYLVRESIASYRKRKAKDQDSSEADETYGNRPPNNEKEPKRAKVNSKKEHTKRPDVGPSKTSVFKQGFSEQSSKGGKVFHLLNQLVKTSHVGGQVVVHRASFQHSSSKIKRILNKSPVETGFSEKSPHEKLEVKSFPVNSVPEPYIYPLNLAIVQGASSEVLDQMIYASPSVLSKKDGSQQETSLCILLKYRLGDLDTVEKILLKSPQSAAICDRHSNTPLHIACCHSAPLNIVRHLYDLYPRALHMHNFHGATPLAIALSRTCSCPEEVAMFLRLSLVRATKFLGNQ